MLGRPLIVRSALPFVLLAAIAVPAGSSTGTVWHYQLDPASSAVSARVAFMGIASKTARFPAMVGSVTLAPQPDSQEPRSITFDVTLDARALRASDNVTLKRLKSADFFDVENHPKVRFTGDTIHMTGKRTAEVSGQLTARGVTRAEVMHVTFGSDPLASRGATPIELEGRMRIDRRDYGMTAWSLVVGKKVDITIRTRMMPR
ncbi:YceI family protein [Novosphingobium mangrovi (ex Huang et al. 2023)]|uniref:YceI family protein n=1 Tax=Novosphingobium mangrovi (ex Huang et al. 2023) TaxID=2976432 RepID=A0ABT2I204_9SPHN|nr:YceI family protein [Novosphingobium mangrovi (ex Huang et al. 2023)]MCT2398837.1 YceI family protein [Novosphingobium mangrovi (ex Huang et al. 2023)]